MAEIVWSQEASRSLEAIYVYLDKHNVDAAEATIRGIIRKTDLLRRFPGLGPVLQGYEDESLHAFVYGHYRIIYKLVSKTKVELVGIYHGAMDLDRLLDPND